MSKTLFGLLVGLRLLVALTSYGYIHPDEWFQNGEVVAGSSLARVVYLRVLTKYSSSIGDMFDIDTLRTWEFDPAMPCRSVVPLYIVSGAMWALKSVGMEGS